MSAGDVDIAGQLRRDIEALASSLDYAEAKKALRRTLREEARVAQNYARRQLRKIKVDSGRRGFGRGRSLRGPRLLHNAMAVSKTVIGKEYRTLTGFSVRALPFGKRYMHANMQGRLKPVAFWLNSGASRGKRGSIEPRDFIGAAKRATIAKTEARIAETFAKWVGKVIQQRGRK